MDVISPDSTVPLYRQAADFVRQRIQRGDFKIGDRIPSEAQLGQLLGVSRITVRQAVSELERDGLLKRVPGKGTFVQSHPTRLERLTSLTGFGTNVIARGLEPGYRILRVGMTKVPPGMAEILALPSDDAFEVSRVLLAGGQPVGLHTSYLPPWILMRAPPGRFTAQALEEGSLYRAIGDAGIDLVRADEVVAPGGATAEEAQALGCEEEAWVLRVTRTTYTVASRPIEYVLLTYRADLYSYRVTLYADARP